MAGSSSLGAHAPAPDTRAMETNMASVISAYPACTHEGSAGCMDTQRVCRHRQTPSRGHTCPRPDDEIPEGEGVDGEIPEGEGVEGGNPCSVATVALQPGLAVRDRPGEAVLSLLLPPCPALERAERERACVRKREIDQGGE